MIIADGYNVVYKWKCLKKLINDVELACSRFINIISNYQGYSGEEIIIVLDSSDSRGANLLEHAPPNIKVIYAPSDQGADIYIERLVIADSKPEQIMVVTGDVLLRTAVARRGAQTISPERFEEEVIKVIGEKNGL